MSGHFGNCSKHCNSWCSDAVQSRYFRTATNGYFAGVAFNVRGQYTVKKWADGRRTADPLVGTLFLVVFSNKQWYFNNKFDVGFLSVLIKRVT